MFFSVRTSKEKVIMAGVILALVPMILLAIRLVLIGGVVAWALAAVFAGVPFLVYKGLRLGYSLAKFIVGFFVIVIAGGTLNPFTYEDFMRSKGNYNGFATVMLFVGLLLIFAFYGLEQHWKIRGVRSTSVPDTFD